MAEYGPVLQREVQRHGLPTADYVRSDTPLFEQIAAHEARFNRVLIYRGNTLHSGMISADMAFSDDPRTGRLTVNTFARLD